MIDRVGTLGLSQLLLSQYQNIQSSMAKTQQQISSGKVGTQYADVQDQSGVLAAAKSKAGGIADYTASVKNVVNKLNLYDTQLQGMSDLTANLRQALGEALATGSGTGFMEQVQALYAEAVNTLNTQVDGKYIYGGSRTDTPPVNAPTLDDLVAAPSVAAVFDNTTLKQTDRLDDNETVETGVDASDLATNLFQMFKDIATANAATPFGTKLDQAQNTFLSTQNAAVPAIQSGIDVAAAQNAAHFKQASDALDRHETMTSYFTKFIGDIEDADLPTAIAKLNQDQVAVQASARMIASLNQLSLLNFLPVT
jgi:flagellar hook-associated protein 3 FlgL